MNEIRDRLASELRRHATIPHLSFTDQATLILRDVFRAVLLEEIAAIRAQGHITDTDAEQGMREMRAMAVWRVVERIEGDGHD